MRIGEMREAEHRTAAIFPEGAASTWTLEPGTAPSPRRIGVIGNPRSHAYRAGSYDAVPDHPRPDFAEPASLEALLATLTRFAADSVDLLVVHGGDGTLRDVLTVLPAAYPGEPPELAILASGNTNLAARIFGHIPPGPRGLTRFIAAAQTGRLRRTVCRTLLVSWPDQPDRRALRGLFLGAALYADGKRIADAEIHRRGVHNGLAVGLAVASALLRILFDRGGRLRQGIERRIVLPGQPPREGACFVFLATTLDRLMLRIWPFTEPGGGKIGGAIHWLDIDAPPRRLASRLLAMLWRRSGPNPAFPGHHGGRADWIALRIAQPFVLDGEFFDPGADGILLSDGGQVTIVRP